MTRQFFFSFLLVVAMTTFANESNKTASLYPQENSTTETTQKQTKPSNHEGKGTDSPNHDSKHHSHDEEEHFTTFHFDRIRKRSWVAYTGIAFLRIFLVVVHAGIIMFQTCNIAPDVSTHLANLVV